MASALGRHHEGCLDAAGESSSLASRAWRIMTATSSTRIPNPHFLNTSCSYGAASNICRALRSDTARHRGGRRRRVCCRGGELQGLADIARHFIGGHLAQYRWFRFRVHDVASIICQALLGGVYPPAPSGGEGGNSGVGLGVVAAAEQQRRWRRRPVRRRWHPSSVGVGGDSGGVAGTTHADGRSWQISLATSQDAS